MKQYRRWFGSFGLLGFSALVACAGEDDAGGTGSAVSECTPGGLMPCMTAATPPGASGEQAGEPPAAIGVGVMPSAEAMPMPTTSMGMAMNDEGPVAPVPTTQMPVEEPMEPTDEVPGGEDADDDIVEEMPAEEPVDEEPVDEEPVDEEPVDEEPVDEEPVDEEPTEDPTDVVTDEVPDIEYCADVAAWDAEWSQWENEVLLLVNERRAEGADCGSEGSFEPAEPLSMDPLLRCTARVHSLDMYERMFFDHTNPDGDGPGERLDAAEYMGSTWGENIAQGYPSPEDVVQGWMESDGHCSNIMAEAFSLIGVGYYAGDAGSGMGGFSRNSHYWTQNFGAPPRDFGGGR